MKKILLFLALLGMSNAKAQSDGEPAAQWNFNGNGTTNNNADAEDWVYDILPTENHEYIVCGYTEKSGSVPIIFKLDHLGRLVWTHVQTSSINSNGIVSPANAGGRYFSLIKTANGYAAVGQIGWTFPPNTSSVRFTIITEVSENGTLIKNGLFYPTGFTQNNTQFSGLTTADLVNFPTYSAQMSPDGTTIYLAGYFHRNANANLNVTADIDAFVAKVEYSSFNNITANDCWVGLSQGSDRSQFNKIILRPNGNSFDVVACGYQSRTGDGTVYTNQTTTNSNNATFTEKKKDMWVVSLTPNLQSEVFNKLYNKTSPVALNSIVYNEVGPATARVFEQQANLTPPVYSYPSPNAAQPISPVMMDKLKTSVNVDERGSDIIATQDGKLAMVGIINRVGIYNFQDNSGSFIFSSAGGLTDAIRSNYWFDVYQEGDAFLFKLDPTNGNVIYNRNIGHYGSIDFILKIQQRACGTFLIAGSSSDYVRDPVSNNLIIDEYDGFISEFPDMATNLNSDVRLWKRYYRNPTDGSFCSFALANTLDGGFIVGGDNDIEEENFTVTKFSDPGSKLQSFALPSGDYTVSGNETWPNSTIQASSRIAANIIVPAGTSLTIDGCNLQFAASDHLKDYYNYTLNSTSARQGGITVEKGGYLNIKNSTLNGIVTNCGMQHMWDGIRVIGDPTLDQTNGNQGDVLIENSTIKNAVYGIYTGLASRQYLEEFIPNTQSAVNGVESYNYSSRYTDLLPNGGGKIRFMNSTMENCRFGVNLHEYPDPNFIGQFSSVSAPYFYGSTFISNSAMKDPYLYAVGDGRVQTTAVQITANTLDKIGVYNSNFSVDNNIDIDLRPTGIWMANTSARIEKSCPLAIDIYGNCVPSGPTTGNIFMNFRVAVDAIYSIGYSSRPLSLWQNEFHNNLEALNITGQQVGLKVTQNKFFIPESATIQGTNYVGRGVSLFMCTGYDVSHNIFDKKIGFSGVPAGSIGVFVQGFHDYNDLVYYNDFNNLEKSTYSQARNGNSGFNSTGLQWKCNDYLSGNNFSIYRSAYDGFSWQSPPTLRENQGECQGAYGPAGNRFYLACNGQNRLYTAAGTFTPQAVTYNNNNANTVFDPLQSCISNDFTNNSCLMQVGDQTPRNEVCKSNRYETDPDEDVLDDITAERQAAINNGDSALANALSYELFIETSTVARNMALRGAYDSAGALLIQYERPSQAINMYLLAGNLTGADDALSAMPQNSLEEQQLKQIYTEWLLRLNEGTHKNIALSLDAALLANIIETGTDLSKYSAAILSAMQGAHAYPWPLAAEPDGSNARLLQMFSENKTESPYSIKIYPNPATTMVTIEVADPSKATIYNQLGERVKVEPLMVGKNQLSTTCLAPGVYFIFVRADSGKTYRGKLTIK